jgi:hypothetical protein
MSEVGRDPDEGWQTVGSGVSREAHVALTAAWRAAEQECEALRDQLTGAVEALRQIRQAALSTAGGDRERYRAKVAEIIEITGTALGGQ